MPWALGQHQPISDGLRLRRGPRSWLEVLGPSHLPQDLTTTPTVRHPGRQVHDVVVVGWGSHLPEREQGLLFGRGRTSFYSFFFHMSLREIHSRTAPAPPSRASPMPRPSFDGGTFSRRPGASWVLHGLPGAFPKAAVPSTRHTSVARLSEPSLHPRPRVSLFLI